MICMHRWVSEFAERIADHDLPAKSQPWLDAVAADSINENTYVVTATTALACDVPQSSTGPLRQEHHMMIRDSHRPRRRTR